MLMPGRLSMRPIAAAALLALVGGAKAEPAIDGSSITGTRDARYCEIIPVVRDGFHLKATVYNTLGLNDCPPAIGRRDVLPRVAPIVRSPRTATAAATRHSRP